MVFFSVLLIIVIPISTIFFITFFLRGKITIFYSLNWIRSLVFWNPGQMVIVGDEKGRCTRFSISPERMASEIKQHLSRNLTKEEWQYYIGELAEYEAYR